MNSSRSVGNRVAPEVADTALVFGGGGAFQKFFGHRCGREGADRLTLVKRGAVDARRCLEPSS